MSLSQREKTLIIIAVYALAIFCFVMFLYLPGQAKIAALQADNQQLTQEQTRLEAIRQKQEQSKPVDETSDLAMVKEQLPTEQEMIPVLKFLDETTNKCDVELASLEYRGAREDEGAARTLTFAVETSGSIFDLIDFLRELLAAPRFISVANVSFNACRAESISGSSDEESIPTYYIAPPGIPQAKLERVKVEIEETQTSGDTNERVADSFIPDQFDMKVTINAYYSPEQPDEVQAPGEDSSGEPEGEEESAADSDSDEAESAADSDSEGRI